MWYKRLRSGHHGKHQVKTHTASWHESWSSMCICGLVTWDVYNVTYSQWYTFSNDKRAFTLKHWWYKPYLQMQRDTTGQKRKRIAELISQTVKREEEGQLALCFNNPYVKHEVGKKNEKFYNAHKNGARGKHSFLAGQWHSPCNDTTMSINIPWELFTSENTYTKLCAFVVFYTLWVMRVLWFIPGDSCVWCVTWCLRGESYSDCCMVNLHRLVGTSFQIYLTSFKHLTA